MRLTAALASISILAACAPRPGNIQPTFVPPETYENLTCDQISTERDRIRDKVNRLTDQQNQKATTDAVAVAGAVIFWPAAFALAAGSDRQAELAGDKGKYDALTQAGIRKGCLPPGS